MSRYSGPQLSGKAYVPAVYHDEPLNEDIFMKIPIRKPKNCDHGTTICSTWTCVESWAIDHHLLFHRTVGGRSLAFELGFDPSITLRSDPAKPTPPPTVTR